MVTKKEIEKLTGKTLYEFIGYEVADSTLYELAIAELAKLTSTNALVKKNLLTIIDHVAKLNFQHVALIAELINKAEEKDFLDKLAASEEDAVLIHNFRMTKIKNYLDRAEAEKQKAEMVSQILSQSFLPINFDNKFINELVACHTKGHKLQAVKDVKEKFALGLKEAKDYVDIIFEKLDFANTKFTEE